MIIGALGPAYDRKGSFSSYTATSTSKDATRLERRRSAKPWAQEEVAEALLLGFDVAMSAETYEFLSVGPEDKFESAIQPSER